MTTAPNFRHTRLACYTAYFTMASVACVPPLLFVTFREMYAISYTLLGTLVLTNFCTQLLIDLIFTAFSRYFNVQKVVRTMPLITSLGFVVKALLPTSLPPTASRQALSWAASMLFPMSPQRLSSASLLRIPSPLCKIQLLTEF